MLRIHAHPGVAKVAVNDTRLVLLVVVDPLLADWIRSRFPL